MYVEEQAANAKAAFKQTLGEIGQGVGKGVSIRQWTAAHPWVMMSSAAVAGFAAGCAAIPAKDETFRQKLDELKAALRKEKSDNHDGDGHGEDGHPRRKSFLASIVGDVLRAAIPAVGSVVSAAMQRPPTPEESMDSRGDPTGNSVGNSAGNAMGS
jgi:hypothetical protein